MFLFVQISQFHTVHSFEFWPTHFVSGFIEKKQIKKKGPALVNVRYSCPSNTTEIIIKCMRAMHRFPKRTGPKNLVKKKKGLNEENTSCPLITLTETSAVAYK